MSAHNGHNSGSVPQLDVVPHNPEIDCAFCGGLFVGAAREACEEPDRHDARDLALARWSHHLTEIAYLNARERGAPADLIAALLERLGEAGRAHDRALRAAHVEREIARGRPG